jgi:hypothetical protein
MTLYPGGHLFVTGLGRRDEDDGPAGTDGDLLGERRLPATSSAEE